MAVTELLDKRHLNDIPWFAARATTIEHLALFVYRNVQLIIEPHPHSVDSVSVSVENCGAANATSHSISVTFRGETMSSEIEQFN